MSGFESTSWLSFTLGQVTEFCHTQGGRTFTLAEFYTASESAFTAFAPHNQHRRQKVRQQLQRLRDSGALTFVDNHGTYTLRGVDLLRGEVEQPELVTAMGHDENEKEYARETHARYQGWVRVARMTYGEWCLVERCLNTFLKADGTRYIEVHHIVPLCDGGEDAIWNLSVLCAHHHRMAHFAAQPERVSLRDALFARTQHVLTTPMRQALGG